MSITVERAYRLDIGGTKRVLSEDEARALLVALSDALGVLPHPEDIAALRDHATAEMLPPQEFVSGPVAEALNIQPPRESTMPQQACSDAPETAEDENPPDDLDEASRTSQRGADEVIYPTSVEETTN